MAKHIRDRVLARRQAAISRKFATTISGFRNHLEELKILLSTADFGNLLHVYVRPNGVIEILPGDLSRSEMRRRMIEEPYNFFGSSFAGYRMAAYQQLPERWAPAPPDIWTDLFMWRKFIAMGGLVFATRAAVTALHFATSERHDATLDERRDENRRFLELIRDPRARSEMLEAARHQLLDRALERDRIWASRVVLEAELKRTQQLLAVKQSEITSMLKSRSWRLTAPLRKLAAHTRRVGAASLGNDPPNQQRRP